MTSTTTTISCGNCGAVDLGTRFCETCGAALRTAPAPVAANPSPSAPADPREFTMAFRIYLAAYLAGGLVEIAAEFAPYSLYQGSMTWWGVVNAVLAIIALAVAGGLLLAAFATPVSLGRKAAGLTLVSIQPVFLLLAVIANYINLNDLYTWFLFSTVVLGLVPVFTVLAWLLVTGLPARSYLALAIVIPITLISFVFAGWSGRTLFRSVLEAAGVVIALIVARRLARRPRELKPAFTGSYSPSPGTAARTNTLALLALIFGVLGGTILPIIFGHIARSQIRRTGESGWGLALAGLILGYLSSAVVLILIIAAIAVAARSGTYL